MRIYIPHREFVIPYIARRLPDENIELAARPDESDIAIISPDEKVPECVATVLVCPNIVGTGMTGLPMTIARHIARGSFYHLGGNEARLSTIHATDVARAVELVKDIPGQFTATDCDDPTYHDFAEALAWRINHKRILSLNSRWVRWIISPQLRRLITDDRRVDGSEFSGRFDFRPTPVVEYLRNHVYDDESL